MIAENVIYTFGTVKLVTYVPVAETETFIKHLLEWRIMEADSPIRNLCYSQVQSIYTPIDGTNAYSGSSYSGCRSIECKVEFLTNASSYEEVMAYVRKIHPYGVPRFEIIPVLEK